MSVSLLWLNNTNTYASLILIFVKIFSFTIKQIWRKGFSSIREDIINTFSKRKGAFIPLAKSEDLAREHYRILKNSHFEKLKTVNQRTGQRERKKEDAVL